MQVSKGGIFLPRTHGQTHRGEGRGNDRGEGEDAKNNFVFGRFLVGTGAEESVPNASSALA